MAERLRRRFPLPANPHIPLIFIEMRQLIKEALSEHVLTYMTQKFKGVLIADFLGKDRIIERFVPLNVMGEQRIYTITRDPKDSYEELESKRIQYREFSRLMQHFGIKSIYNATEAQFHKFKGLVSHLPTEPWVFEGHSLRLRTMYSDNKELLIELKTTGDKMDYMRFVESPVFQALREVARQLGYPHTKGCYTNSSETEFYFNAEK